MTMAEKARLVGLLAHKNTPAGARVIRPSPTLPHIPTMNQNTSQAKLDARSNPPKTLPTSPPPVVQPSLSGRATPVQGSRVCQLQPRASRLPLRPPPLKVMSSPPAYRAQQPLRSTRAIATPPTALKQPAASLPFRTNNRDSAERPQNANPRPHPLLGASAPAHSGLLPNARAGSTSALQPKLAAGGNFSGFPMGNTAQARPFVYKPQATPALRRQPAARPIFSGFRGPVVGAIQRAKINVGEATQQAAQILGVDATPTDKPHTKGGTGRGQGGVESHQARDRRAVARVNAEVGEAIREKTGATMKPSDFVHMKEKEAEYQAKQSEKAEQSAIEERNKAVDRSLKDRSLFTYVLLAMDIDASGLTSYEKALVREFREGKNIDTKSAKRYNAKEKDAGSIRDAIEWLKAEIS
jgi:hypothetical protein